MLGEQAGRIGSQSEKGRMSQRNDAGKAENEIERQGQQGEDRNLIEQQQPAWR